jgi:hypothetical protein
MATQVKEWIDWIIKGLVGFFLIQGLEFMQKTESGLNDLSLKLAVIVEKVANQDKILERHEKTLEEIRNGRH